MFNLLGHRAAATATILLFTAWAHGAGTLVLDPVVSGVDNPTFLTHAGDGSGRLFILEKDLARVRIAENSTLLPTAFLDLHTSVSAGGERGLLGIAFHPSYSSNGRFFVYYNDLSGNIQVSEFHRSGGDPNLADPTEFPLLHIDHPTYSNHNGGMLAFGPDGLLYIGTGDGGGGGDPFGNGQNTEVLLGKILRIDVDGTPDVGLAYRIPPGNPFAGQSPSRGEIFAYGMRNPWRFSFDRGGSHQLFCADVGQGEREEIDIVTSGGNYGWNIMEGFDCFEPAAGCNMAGLTLPIFAYDHSGGNCSIIGGFIYRGALNPGLTGKFIFGDFCSGRIWSLQHSGNTWNSTPLAETGLLINSFGEDEAGEIYLCPNGGDVTIYRLRDTATGASTDVSVGPVTFKQKCKDTSCTVQQVIVPVTNNGGDAPKSLLSFYLSDDERLTTGAGGDLLIKQTSIGAVKAGKTKTKKLGGGVLKKAGAHSGQTVFAVADDEGVLNDTNRTNNTAASPVLP
jgi:glucose/arabinose dehydrogenase